MKIYTNHSGTTQESFRIGKRGVDLIRGVGPPDESTPGAQGSLYFQTDIGIVYVKSLGGEWQALATQQSMQLSMVMLAETIERCVKLCLLTVTIVVFVLALMWRFPLVTPT